MPVRKIGRRCTLGTAPAAGREEAFMPSRAKQNVSGDLGELGAFSHFMRMGHAVNSLSRPGYGWEAQVHTTADVIYPGQLPIAWKMSGLTAHIQVRTVVEMQAYPSFITAPVVSVPGSS